MTTMPWGLERLSEKTLELNFASQLNHRCGGTLLWFGLTQKQEAECGFDIATKTWKCAVHRTDEGLLAHIEGF